MEQPLASELLDLTKENIQPLKHGRRADQLFAALQAETDTNAQKKLDEQREQFELAIRMYEGDDPLEPRYQFAHWIEQSYPKLGPNSKLLPLLEDTINLYKDDARYRQDHRFVEMLVKFVDSQANPIELYQMAYNQGLGTMCATLYHAWAEELDQNQDWKRANQIYELGIMNRAEPLDRLKQAHEQFQLSVGRRMMNGDTQEEAAAAAVVAPPRQAFSKLKKAQVKGSRQTHANPGIFKSQPFVSSSNKQMSIPIFQENNEENFMGGCSRAQIDLFPKTSVTNKENSVKAGPWKSTQSSSRSSSHAVVPPSTPSFHVHEDAQEEKVNYQTPIVPRALKSIRVADIACPVAIFEAPDPSKKVMYPKHKVYVGGREFQMEELRAAIYNKRYGIETGQKDLCEFQTPMPHFGKSRASSRFVPGASSSTPYLEPKALPVRLFADNSDNSDVEDEHDAQSIKFYRNDKNLLRDETVCEVGLDKLNTSIEVVKTQVSSTLNDNETLPELNCDKINNKIAIDLDLKTVDKCNASSSKVEKNTLNGVDLDKLNITDSRASQEKKDPVKKKSSQSNEQNSDRLRIKKKTKPPSGLSFAIFTE